MTTDLTVAEKYADPQVVKFWQKLGKQGLQQAEQEMITRYFPASGHVLDLGCGAGRAVLGLSQQGYIVTGVDLSLSMLQAGRSLSSQMRLGGANLLTLPFANNTFTAAFMFFGALQHIPGRQKRRQALAEMVRVVQPGGVLIIGLDNLAPTLLCYAYWLKEKLRGSSQKGTSSQPASNKADSTLWDRNTSPLLWHLQGMARTLRWRSWPGFVDITRQINPFADGLEPGDTQVAQFSRPATPGRVYYHIYQAKEMIDDAAHSGWRLRAYHAGRELSEGCLYPPLVRDRDKQLFFAFQKQ